MKPFTQKVKDSREALNLDRIQVANLTGVSPQTIAAYEAGYTKPRGKILRRLAKALQVTVDYLIRDDIGEPQYGILKEPHVERVREILGDTAAKEMDSILERNSALFAGGPPDLDDEKKDSFYASLTQTYLNCKFEAKETFGRKKNKG